MLDIPGHLNRYRINGGDFDEGMGLISGPNDAPDACGERRDSFILAAGNI